MTQVEETIVQTFKDAYDGNMTLREIAQEHGLLTSDVWRIIHEKRIPKKHKRKLVKTFLPPFQERLKSVEGGGEIYKVYLNLKKIASAE